ncbi:MAG: hypothetical protein AB1422_17670 [bacterium]
MREPLSSLSCLPEARLKPRTTNLFGKRSGGVTKGDVEIKEIGRYY